MTALAPATVARLGVLADQLDAEALGRLPFGSGELAEALAQANAVRALAGPAGGEEGGCFSAAEASPGLAAIWSYMDALRAAGRFAPGFEYEEDCASSVLRVISVDEEDEPDIDPADLAAEEAAEGPAAWGGGDLEAIWSGPAEDAARAADLAALGWPAGDESLGDPPSWRAVKAEGID